MNNCVLRKPLSSYGKVPTNEHSRRKWLARDVLRQFTVVKAQKTCGAFLVGEYKLVILNGHEYWTGVGHCNRTNSCPWCAPRKLASKRKMVMQLASEAVFGGFFGTFTIPKLHGENLSRRYARIQKVTARFRRISKATIERFGIGLTFATLEETYSPSSGWHPHKNWFFISHMPLEEQQVEAFITEIRDLWVKAAMDSGLTRTSRRAQHIEFLSDPEALKVKAKYSMKQSYYPSTTPDESVARLGSGLSAWDVLALAALSMRCEWIRAYNEYEMAISGKQRLTVYKVRKSKLSSSTADLPNAKGAPLSATT
jgi:hypothetical protein